MTYDRQEACRAWLTYGFYHADGLDRLMEDFDGCAQAVYEQAMTRGSGFLKEYMTAQNVNLLMTYSGKEAMHQMLVTMQEHDMGIMYRDDLNYPGQLLNIQEPPVFLFWRGDPDCLSRRCMTFVGARHASVQGEQATEDITRELSSRGVTIVSGMAQGIDQAAHRGCLKGGSPTVGVMACGLDIRYPAGTKGLKQQIIDGGGVLLSEYHPGDPQIDWHFPRRNRILSGLSKGVVMMECSIRSGSMTTVRHALDQGKDVFAWPGYPGSEAAQGAHLLLRQGAIYFTSADDLLQDMQWEDLADKKKPETKPLSQLPPTQREVCFQLRNGDKTLDELSFATGLSTPQLTGALTLLELQGYIRSLPGKTYHIN